MPITFKRSLHYTTTFNLLLINHYHTTQNTAIYILLRHSSPSSQVNILQTLTLIKNQQCLGMTLSQSFFKCLKQYISQQYTGIEVLTTVERDSTRNTCILAKGAVKV